MLKDFLAAHEPEPIIYLGERLLPFTIGHAILISQYAGEFMRGEEVGLDEIATAIYICSRDYKEASAGMLNGEAVTWAKNFGERLENKCAQLGKRPDMDEEITFFREYLSDAFTCPKIFQEQTGDNTIKSGAAFLAVLKVTMMTAFNMTTEAALNYPMRLAQYEFFTYHEQRGTIRISGQDDEDRREAIAEFQKQNPDFK